MTGSMLLGKRAVITGALANIGAATAEVFAREGASVVVADIHPGIRATADRLRASGANAAYVQADMTDEAAVRSLMKSAREMLGGLDILVNNAGIQREGETETLDQRDWDAHMSVNARSCFLGVKHAIPLLKESASANIVNMASAAGLKGPAGLAAYSASKGAVIAFSNTLARELGPFGIRVNAVCPGWIDTPFNRPIISRLGGAQAQREVVRSTVALRRQGMPSEVAEVIAFLASERASFVNGQAIGIDGGN